MKSLTILVLLILGTTFAWDQAAPTSEQNRFLWCAPHTKKLEGLTMEHAEHYLARNEVIENNTRIISVRAVKVDGTDMAMTKDYRMDRVNVEVKEAKIAKVINIG